MKTSTKNKLTTYSKNKRRSKIFGNQNYIGQLVCANFGSDDCLRGVKSDYCKVIFIGDKLITIKSKLGYEYSCSPDELSAHPSTPDDERDEFEKFYDEFILFKN